MLTFPQLVARQRRAVRRHHLYRRARRAALWCVAAAAVAYLLTVGPGDATIAGGGL